MAYKVFIKRPGEKWGKTFADVPTVEHARNAIYEAAVDAPIGTFLYIRYSNPAKRHVRGYMEPNYEGYVVTEQGIAELRWKKSRDKRHMMGILKGQTFDDLEL